MISGKTIRSETDEMPANSVFKATSRFELLEGSDRRSGRCAEDCSTRLASWSSGPEHV